MFLRLLIESFRRQKRRKALAGAAILLGTTAVTAMLALALGIGDRIHKELAVYGANIVVTPRAADLAVSIGGVDLHPATGNATLHESDLAKLQTIFWHNNITAVSPELLHPLHIVYDVPVPQTARNAKSEQTDDAAQGIEKSMEVPAEGLWFEHQFGSNHTGAMMLHPWWKLSGTLPEGATDVVLGASLAHRLNMQRGSMFSYPISKARDGQTPRAISMQGLVTGVLTTGGSEDDAVLMPLADLQYATDQPGAISRIEIAARTRPEDAFARVNPESLSPAKRDVWYCRPYANSIAYQIREAIPGADAQQVRRVEQSEGTVLSRISGLLWLVSAAALLAAAFAVSAAMATAVLERRQEIGLMRSLGAGKASIATLFYAESGLLAVVTGILGFLAGSLLAHWLGASVFPGTISPWFNPVLLPIIVALALIVAILGSTPAIREALNRDPGDTLRGSL
jgi:putative ABC transport system permease protein